MVVNLEELHIHPRTDTYNIIMAEKFDRFGRCNKWWNEKVLETRPQKVYSEESPPCGYSSNTAVQSFDSYWSL